ISSSSYATSTGMAHLLSIKHDKITRELSKGDYNSKFLWKQSKVYVQEMTQSKDIITLSFDDSIEEKRYTDESELNSWHYDHSFGRSVKGVNFLTALVEVGGMRLPCCVEFVKKDTWVADSKTGKQKRKASVTKNELFRKMLRECDGKFYFDYVLADSWYSSIENMICCKKELKRDFIMALKSNRNIALSLEDKENKKYISIETLQPGQQTVEIWLEELDFPLLLTKQIFKNENDTVGELYLACSDSNLSYDQITTIYKKRWGVEEYHKSIKSNTGFAKSPTKTIKAQTNHYVLSIVAYVKLEWLKQRTCKNHFAMKAQIYLAAQKAAHTELQILTKPRKAA
ncbi:transposase, partial [Flavobacterium sp. GT3R68]|uniref:IS701 family transposase n=1 Tax=Flavobacterium sp. GT3R68 TaxID=2594437 RepID=UPI001185BE06